MYQLYLLLLIGTSTADKKDFKIVSMRSIKLSGLNINMLNNFANFVESFSEIITVLLTKEGPLFWSTHENLET